MRKDDEKRQSDKESLKWERTQMGKKVIYVINNAFLLRIWV